MNPVIWAIDADGARLPDVDGIQTSTELDIDQIGVLRAMNVLRQYGAEEAQKALLGWASRLSPNGILVEGTTDKHGELATFFCLGQTTELVLMTTFSRGFGPWMFRDYLPQSWRRTVKPGTALFDFFDAWASEFSAQSDKPDAESRFFASLEALDLAGLRWGTVRGGVFLCMPVSWSPEKTVVLGIGSILSTR